MNHPDELLAEYIDGALAAPEAALVDEHLQTCARCRDETVLARTARASLNSLPEATAPAGVASRALALAGGEAAVAATSPRWLRFAGAAAAAAAILVLAVALPNIGQRSEPEVPAAMKPLKGEASTTSPGGKAVIVTSTDYDEAAVSELARSGSSFSSVVEPVETGVQEDTVAMPDAVACLHTAYPYVRSDPLVVIQATFKGTPAFLGIYEEGPGGGDPLVSRIVTVAAIHGCRFLSHAQASI